MSLNEWVFWVGTVTVVADAVIAWTHVILYVRGSKWRSYQEGVALMWTIGSYALVLSYVALLSVPAYFGKVHDTLLENYPERGIVRIVVFGMLMIVLSRWLILLIRNQRRTRRKVKRWKTSGQ